MANTKITTNVIADDAITTAKIADDAVGNDQLASGLTLGGNTAATLSTAAQPNITSVGTLTTLTVDDITINGSTISDAADLLIDVGGSITLDSDSGVIDFDDGGTNIGRIENASSDFKLESRVQDKDIVLVGNDGGVGVEALRLDMSEAGHATFNAGATFGATTVVDVGAPSSSDQVLGSFRSQAGREIGFVWDDSASTLGVATITAHDLVFHTSGNSSEKMRITTGGNVGIGANSISSWAKLQVAGTAGAQDGAKQALYIQSPTTTANEGVGIRMSAASGSHEAVGIIGMVNNASGNAGAMTFHTYNLGATIPEAMRITNTGNVGIGTTSPAQSLDTTGKIRIRDGGNTTVPSIQMGASGVDGLSLPATNTVAFITNSTERMRISSTGDTTFTGASSTARLGSHSYGTTLETTTSDGSDTMVVGLDAGSGAGSTSRGAGIWCYGNEASTHGGSIVAQLGASGDYKFHGGSGGDKVFHLNGAGAAGLEMTNSRFIVGGAYNSNTQYGMTSGNGNIGIYGKGAYSSCDAHIEIATSSDVGWAPLYINKFNWASGENDRWIQFLMNSTGDSGTISYNGTDFVIAQGSDYRLKENIVDYSGGLAKLEELKVRTYNKKEGPSKDITQVGFIAHEAATANIPGFIMGEKDAMKTDEGGETVPDYQQISRDRLIPYLVSAIQELSAKVKELESK